LWYLRITPVAFISLQAALKAISPNNLPMAYDHLGFFESPIEVITSSDVGIGAFKVVIVLAYTSDELE
jgi:hypothetical protein